MAGIVGLQKGDKDAVAQMLTKIAHRGDDGLKIIEQDGVTLGAVWPEAQRTPVPAVLKANAVWDGAKPPLPGPDGVKAARNPFALASLDEFGGIFIARDALGINPLYYSYTDTGYFCFASEVKAILDIAQDVREFPPQTCYSSERGFEQYPSLNNLRIGDKSPERIALELQMWLDQAVCQRIDRPVMGAWLSGGLDSSALVALVRPHVNELHTFAAGMVGAPDLVYAQEVAEYFDTRHHELIVTLPQALQVLPDVIYHLESFDALLVRSAVTNYLVAEKAADHVDVSFSGEGADELFAGYRYLSGLADDELDEEMRALTTSLHNTALQRVDRSASAHGLVVHVPFLDPGVVTYAQAIPASLKLMRNPEVIEKFILRKALEGILPDSVVWRKKTKFWQGTGLGETLAEHAEHAVTQSDFESERVLPNGWVLNTKEELYYYRIFKNHFDTLDKMDWMGRTKSAPVAP